MITYKLANNGNSYIKFVDGSQVSSGLIENEEFKQWLAEGNIPEPEFTEEELDIQLLVKQIQESKQYLTSTDFKMTIDYYSTLTEAERLELTIKRAEAREFIRLNEVQV